MMDIWDEIAGESFNGFKYSKLFGRDPFKLMVLVFFGGDLYFQRQNWGNNYEITVWLMGVYNATLLGSTRYTLR